MELSTCRVMKGRGNVFFKKIDRNVGIPIVRILSLFKKKRNKPNLLKRIAILKTVAIGDTILLSSIICDLRREYPDAEIVFFSGSSNHAVTKYLCGIDKVILLKIEKPIETIKVIRSHGVFDLFIDAAPWARVDALYTFFSRAKFTLGFKSESQFRHYLYDVSIIHSRNNHEIDNNANLIRSFVKNFQRRPTINVPFIENIEGYFKEKGESYPVKPYIVIHPCSGGYKGIYKEWNPKNWVSVIEHFKNYDFVITGSTDDVKKADDILKIASISKVYNVSNFAGKTNLLETISIINQASLVISVNTGILHIAAAVNRPVIAINGPVPSLRWGAIGEKVVNLESSIQPYLHLGFEYPKYPPNCMDSISTENVIAAASRFLII